MNTATADGGRALYGIARDDMTVKWLYHLNRFHVPARGMSVDMVVNIGLLLLLGANNFVILYISNIGYVFCHVLALTGFLLLRRDRPELASADQDERTWLPIAAVLALFNLILVLDGVIDQKVASLHRLLRVQGPAAVPRRRRAGRRRAPVLLPARRAGQGEDHVPRPGRSDVPNEEQMKLLHEEEVPA